MVEFGRGKLHEIVQTALVVQAAFAHHNRGGYGGRPTISVDI